MTTRLDNSRRRLDKVTYTPLKLPLDDLGGSALQLAGLVDELRPLPGETSAAIADEQTPPPAEVRKALAALDQFAAVSGGAKRLEALASLATTTTDALVKAIELVRLARQAAFGRGLADVRELVRKYNETLAAAPDGGAGDIAATYGSRPQPPLDPAIASELGAATATVAATAMAWADDHADTEVGGMLNGQSATLPAIVRRNAFDFVTRGLSFLLEQVRRASLSKGQLTQRNLQPLGLLHLEQLVVTPLETERGELVYSLPLAPHEKVTLAHKEWSLRQEEYSRFVQDYFENYSERGVAEKNDIAVSTKSETEHSKTLNMSKPVVPGAATIADSVDAAPAALDVTTERESQEKSRRDTRELTEKASTLAVRDQKISFTVTTTSGVEDFTARLFENKNEKSMMLIDYFRRMRKWHNQLYRTGIRLTYDVVLPDPGRRLRERWLEVKQLDEQLTAPFEFSVDSWVWDWVQPSYAGTIIDPSVAGTAGAPSDVLYFRQLADQYGVTLPPAPERSKTVQVGRAVTEASIRTTDAFTFTISLTVPEGYDANALTIQGGVASPTDSSIFGEYAGQGLVMKAGQGWKTLTLGPVGFKFPRVIDVLFTTWKGAVGNVSVIVGTSPSRTTWHQWRVTAANIVRQGALARYNERREALRQRRAMLMGELSAADALTLRRMEREQVMYLVLQWLFPEFDQSGQAYKDAADQKPGSWQPAMEYGEYIKFVHQSIDWDNALVLLYPYFWDKPDSHASKLMLDHPDAAHREFLRAGAARVIMAINPGQEEAVVTLLDKGQIGATTPGGIQRFKRVIEKVLAAHTRFETLHNQEFGQGPAKPGELIGEWFDWTPTSALDMTVKLEKVED